MNRLVILVDEVPDIVLGFDIPHFDEPFSMFFHTNHTVLSPELYRIFDLLKVSCFYKVSNSRSDIHHFSDSEPFWFIDARNQSL